MISFTFEGNDIYDQTTIINFLKKRLNTTPLNLIHKLIRNKKILVNGKKVISKFKLIKNDKVEIWDNSIEKGNGNNFFNPKNFKNEYKHNLKIIKEDQNILIVSKPAGLDILELDEIVNNYLYKKNSVLYQKLHENFFCCTAIHRLDKVVSGLVIYPKNNVSQRILNSSIKDNKQIIKNYLARCRIGKNFELSSLPDLIKGYIIKDDYNQKMVFNLEPFEEEEGKPCSLYIIKKEIKNNILELEIALNTGRKHQIRATLAFFNIPIIGDYKYGDINEIGNKKIELYAYEIIIKKLPVPLNYLNNQIIKDKHVEFL